MEELEEMLEKCWQKCLADLKAVSGSVNPNPHCP
jgi:hypothetical protein